MNTSTLLERLMKPKPRPGDRVRLTMEGLVIRTVDSLHVLVDGRDTRTYYFNEELSAPTFKIEILEAPLAVGDRVTVATCGVGKILAIDGGFAWVRWSSGARGEHPLSSLKRIEPSHED
jgi:hypothetical protein